MRPLSYWLDHCCVCLNEMQPIASIAHIAAARRLAILCDGQLILLDEETLDGQALPGLKVRSERHCLQVVSGAKGTPALRVPSLPG